MFILLFHVSPYVALNSLSLPVVYPKTDSKLVKAAITPFAALYANPFLQLRESKKRRKSVLRSKTTVFRYR